MLNNRSKSPMVNIYIYTQLSMDHTAMSNRFIGSVKACFPFACSCKQSDFVIHCKSKAKDEASVLFSSF